MQVLQDYRKLYALFHIANLMKVHSVLDFGGSIARTAIFSRRYWKNYNEHIDLSKEVRLDSFDLFDVCKFPVYQQLYDNIYHELDEVPAERYDMVAFIDVIPFLETDVFLSLCHLFGARSSLLLIQLPKDTDFPLEELQELGRCVRTSIVSYDCMVIWTDNN